jgi:hypothetical protein
MGNLLKNKWAKYVILGIGILAILYFVTLMIQPAAEVAAAS